MWNAQVEVWRDQNVGVVDVIVEPDGSRTVREAADIIEANVAWLQPRHPDMVLDDGEGLQLDSAGRWIYRRLRPTVGPFAAYERVTVAA